MQSSAKNPGKAPRPTALLLSCHQISAPDVIEVRPGLRLVRSHEPIEIYGLAYRT